MSMTLHGIKQKKLTAESSSTVRYMFCLQGRSADSIVNRLASGEISKVEKWWVNVSCKYGAKICSCLFSEKKNEVETYF